MYNDSESRDRTGIEVPPGIANRLDPSSYDLLIPQETKGSRLRMQTYVQSHLRLILSYQSFTDFGPHTNKLRSEAGLYDFIYRILTSLVSRALFALRFSLELKSPSCTSRFVKTGRSSTAVDSFHLEMSLVTLFIGWPWSYTEPEVVGGRSYMVENMVS